MILALINMQKFMSLFGIVAFVFVAWLLSEDRSRISWRTVLWGVGLQFVFAVIVLMGFVVHR